jgi:hypothetical protein
MTFGRILTACCVFLGGLAVDSAWAINGGTLKVFPRNGWRAFEVISYGNDPAGDGITFAMPDTFDGIGAWMPNASILRLNINHENGDANVSEVNLNLANFQTAIRNIINTNSTGGVSFVTSAQQAYYQWTANGGTSWTPTTSAATTSFYRFCSSQFHKANTFGAGRGFADNVYITGEEGSTNRLFALDVANRSFYQLSGVVGHAPAPPSPLVPGVGGMPYDPWENAALLDTGDTTHVALLLSPDGGTQTLQLYIGDKGKNAAGNTSTSFLARNGLAYGRYYFLNLSTSISLIPTGIPNTNGFFDANSAGGFSGTKMEDVDTNPSIPTQAVLGNQNYGVFTFDFNLHFTGGDFDAAASSFSVTKIRQPSTGVDGSLGDADNVDWTGATTLRGVSYPNGVIFVNEDSATLNGETWMITPTGGSPTLIADTVGSGGTETSGVLDISSLLGFKPGSILLTSNQGAANGSLTTLINPNAVLAGDFNGDGVVDLADYAVWRKGFGTIYTQTDYDVWRAQFGLTPDGGAGAGLDQETTVPEPVTISLIPIASSGLILSGVRRHGRRSPG